MHLKWLYIHFCSIISTFRQLHGATLWTLCCIWIVRKIACVASVSLRFRSKERPRNRILSFGRARNETRAKKWKCGEGERKEVSFLSSPPLPALLLRPFFARSLTLVPRSLPLTARKRLLRRLSEKQLMPLVQDKGKMRIFYEAQVRATLFKNQC